MLDTRAARKLVPALALAALALGQARADSFSSGSTGALGIVTISTNTTVTLPSDGVLNYQTLTVKNGATLTFTRNARNTPVFILATGDIVIEGGAFIEVDGEAGRSNGLGGRGGPGGFAGGQHIDAQQAASAGQGPGGGRPLTSGYGGYGSYGTKGSTVGGVGAAGSTYGTQLLMPLVGGSGGGGGNGYGGGGGGGAVLLSSTTRIVHNGTVRARGGSVPIGYGVGAGGAIRLVAPTVEGAGALDVSAGSAGAGRARVDTLYNTNLAVTRTPASAPYTIGSVMLSFLDVEPQIDIVGVGQSSIPLGYDGEYLVFLPTGSTASQEVTIKLTDFTGDVPITVALTPEVGDVRLYDAVVDTSGAVAGVVQTEVTVEFPFNVATAVRVWTRPATP